MADGRFRRPPESYGRRRNSCPLPPAFLAVPSSCPLVGGMAHDWHNGARHAAPHSFGTQTGRPGLVVFDAQTRGVSSIACVRLLGARCGSPARGRKPSSEWVGVEGVEPPTSCASCMRSNQLSYTPE